MLTLLAPPGDLKLYYTIKKLILAQKPVLMHFIGDNRPVLKGRG